MAVLTRSTPHKYKRIKAGVQRRAHRQKIVAKLAKHGVGAEIGTFRGDFAAKLLRRTKPTRLHLIDPWEHRPEPAYKRAGFGDRKPGGQQRMDAMYDEVCRRFATEVAAGTVIIHRSRSLAAVGGLEQLDWVYVDGDHMYDAVLADLEAFYPLVKPGGAIAGDDYGVAGWWADGVKRAVDDFVAAEGCELTVMGIQFLIIKPS